MGKAREKNVGWRIDYFIVSKDIIENVSNCNIKQKANPLSLTDGLRGGNKKGLSH